ncbi:MAG: NmrA family NAD(P)-binding protein [Chloroflexota bacterium]
MKVLVYGGTGAQAEPVVYELLRKGHTPVVFSRDITKEKPKAMADAGAILFEGDMVSEDDTLSASQGVDGVALLVPTFAKDPIEAGKQAIKSAQAAGVDFIVWNTSGPLFPQETGDAVNDVRFHVYSALKESKIPHVLLEPTLYAENLLGPWTVSGIKAASKIAYPTRPSFQIGWLPQIDMAKAITSALEQPDLAGKHLRISGIDIVDGPQLAHTFTIALERDITFSPMHPREFGKLIDQFIGPGAGDGIVGIYQPIWDGEISPQMYVGMDETLSSLNVEFTPLVDWVKSIEFMLN